MPPLVTHTVGVAQVSVESGRVSDLRIDKIAPGAAHVAALNLSNANFQIKSGSALLHRVRFILELRFRVHYWYDFGWFGSGGDTKNLDSIFIPFDAGDVVVPALHDIGLSVPSLVATDISAGIAPIVNLALGGAQFERLLAADLKLPAGGFQLGGLGLTSVSIGSLQTPDATVGRVSVGEFAPTGNVVVPSVQLHDIGLPSASAADIRSVAPFALNNIQASTRVVHLLDLGFLGVSLEVTPIINTNIDELVLSGVSISGFVARADIQNVSVPIAISGINLNGISIGAIDVSNLTL